LVKTKSAETGIIIPTAAPKYPKRIPARKKIIIALNRIKTAVEKLFCIYIRPKKSPVTRTGGRIPE
jgi:hypothetical protein